MSRSQMKSLSLTASYISASVFVRSQIGLVLVQPPQWEVAMHLKPFGVCVLKSINYFRLLFAN